MLPKYESTMISTDDITASSSVLDIYTEIFPSLKTNTLSQVPWMNGFEALGYKMAGTGSS